MTFDRYQRPVNVWWSAEVLTPALRIASAPFRPTNTSAPRFSAYKNAAPN